MGAGRYAVARACAVLLFLHHVVCVDLTPGSDQDRRRLEAQRRAEWDARRQGEGER